MRAPEQSAKKKQVIEDLYKFCLARNNWVFTNDEVKQIATKHGFGNPFDVTKVDTKSVLPEVVLKDGYCIAHLGKGRHCFIPELDKWYHEFESIQEEEVCNWRYRKSLLNDIEAGEASVVSFVFNQHILHDFLYEDVVASPKIYVPGRVRENLEYRVGNTRIIAESQQMEVDLTLEYQGTVTVLEAKNRLIKDFAVYQIFHPILYYHKKAKHLKIQIQHFNACYILRYNSRARDQRSTCVRLYLYEFSDPDRLDSIQLVRKAEYRLIRR